MFALSRHRSTRSSRPGGAELRGAELRLSQGGVATARALRPPWRAVSAGTLRLTAPRRPELLLLVALAAALNLWGLSRNQWANEYYSAAVRSMSTSWHNFLFGSLDANGLMTVDKPPLALWVQALSVRVFGMHPLSMLVPQALMGVASTVLVYDLVRRRFGRAAGFAGGLALATTPIMVAVSRHNNPDALLVLCCVAAVWFTVRGLEDGRTRWLVLAGVCVGLGFETKMGVALMVVPGIVAAWLWVAPRGRVAALRQLLGGGAAMVAVGGAWPLLVALTPAANRPWISGTSDNSILSLIVGYNGFGRLNGQSGGPAGGGSSMFGGSAGPLRLLNAALGGQDGWLLGFALVCGAGILIATRGRRADPRTGWILAVGGTFVTVAVAFSAASGIFHPYYVALLAPFAAALVGAGAAHLAHGGRHARIVAPLAVAAAVGTELVVIHDYPGQLSWLGPLLIGLGALCALVLAAVARPRLRVAAAAGVIAVLLVGPAIWSADTLSYAASGTFPSGGPASAAQNGGPGGFGGPGGRGLAGLNGPPGATPGAAPTAGQGGGPALFGGGPSGAPPVAPPGTGFAPPAGTGPGAFAGPFGGGRPGVGGRFGGAGSLTPILNYVSKHGGGTVAVASQSSAASAILAGHANVAGIGGFSGRESQVTVAWLVQEVRAGRIRWVVSDGGGRGAGPSLPGDTRAGATKAVAAAASACRTVTVSGATSSSGQGTVVYDCLGRAGALQALAGRSA